VRAAPPRGVEVRALIAYTNHGGEKNLRALELRLLGAGVIVARTANDLARYHGKMMIIDRSVLYLLAFNFTQLDMERSRSFGIITKNRKYVQEAVKLFEADSKRQEYTPAVPNVIVSPLNARKQLAEFIKGAKRELLIYDPKISDPAMIRLLEDCAKNGIDIKCIGTVRKTSKLPLHKLTGMRLHTRAIIRDGQHVFLGSQSLRTLELDGRREIGLIFKEHTIAGKLIKIFQQDWDASEHRKEEKTVETGPAYAKVAKRVAKAVTENLPSVTPVVEGVAKEIGAEVDLNTEELEETVRNAVKDAVKQAVKGVVREAVGQQRN
jgi:cardiolipin synthase